MSLDILRTNNFYSDQEQINTFFVLQKLARLKQVFRS